MSERQKKKSIYHPNLLENIHPCALATFCEGQRKVKLLFSRHVVLVTFFFQLENLPVSPPLNQREAQA